HIIITLSIRSRGSVQRTQIITKTSSQHLKMNTATLTTFPTKPSQLPRSLGRTPVCHPPRKSSVAMPLRANMLPYSAMKKNDQRRPLYSVWKPATSSLSASARSNGARLQPAVAQVKNVQNAQNVQGSWKRYQFQNRLRDSCQGVPSGTRA